MFAIDVAIPPGGAPLRRTRRWARLAALAALAAALGGCASKLEHSAASGRAGGQGMYKVGKPYQVAGIWYYPKEDYSYDETGIASWYGPGFHKERSANGEIFDQNDVTAAHKTLPMPSLVRVTNLDNGRSIVVRINDRGPFVAGRILDGSRRVAQLLGYERTGTAKVRVKILADESRAIAAAARNNTPYQYADTAPPPKAAPAGRVEVAGLPPPPPPVSRPPVAPPTTIPGDVRDGVFMPAPVVTQMAVTGTHQIYVQAGAFTQYNNATRLRDRVSGIAPASITTARVGGTQFFRVRLGPIDSVEKADSVLARVVDAGGAEARVVVD